MCAKDNLLIRTDEGKSLGKRKTAAELLALVTVGALLAVLVLGFFGMLLCWQLAGIRSALGFLCGAGIVGAAVVLSWLCDLLIQKYLQRFQQFALPGAYLLKIVLLLIVLPLIKTSGFASLEFLLLGFVAAVITVLCITSLIIMKSAGPDFECEQKSEKTT